jgi:hypothetical protein
MDGTAGVAAQAPAVSSPPLPRRPYIRAVGVALAVAAALTVAPWAAAPAASPSRAAAAARAGGADRAAVEAARRFLCPHGGAPARGGRCRAARPAFAASAATAGRDPSVRDWDAGLPAAARRQAPCPEGTVQSRPLFWNDAVRCLPR